MLNLSKEELLKKCDEETNKYINAEVDAFNDIMYLITNRGELDDGVIEFKYVGNSIIARKTLNEDQNKASFELRKCIRKINEAKGYEGIEEFVNFVASKAIPMFRAGMPLPIFMIMIK